MQAWESFVEAQEAEIGQDTVQKWLKTLKVMRFDACNLYLEAKDAFQAMWFEEHIRKKAQKRLFNPNQKRIKIHLSVANAPPKTKTRTAKAQKQIGAAHPTFTLNFDGLDPASSLDNFVTASDNLLAYKVFYQLVQVKAHGNQLEPIMPNPIYLYGPAGSGKTHLLMATANALREQGSHVIYSRAQTFTDHVVSAIRAGEMSTFRQAYRNSDVLIIDDVHVFSRKGATQEEFFHTFNSLHVAGKQILLSANCAPGELQLIEPRLVSRFEWGIVLSLDIPSRSERQTILEMKIKALDYPLHSKVIEFLLDSFASTRSLVKALEALILRLHLSDQSSKSLTGHVTVPMAKQLLSDLLLEESHAALTPQRILQSVVEFFGIRVEDILGKAQTRDCVLPRQISMYLCRSQLRLPYMQIGDLFGRDHSTVMSSVKSIQKGIDDDDGEVANACRSIMRKIKE